MDIVKKGERKNWFYSYNLIFTLDLSIHAKVIYMYLCRCADSDGQAFPSLNTIGKACSIKGRSTVCAALKELQEALLLTSARRSCEDRGKISSLYTIYSEPYAAPDVGEQLPAATPDTPPCLPHEQALFATHTPLVCHTNKPCSPREHEVLPREGLPREVPSPPAPPRGGEAVSAEKELDKRFAEFWGAYPKKTGKLAASRIWQKLQPSAELHNQFLAAIFRAKGTKQWQRDGGRYIPNPVTWLNQGRWEDEPEAETANVIKSHDEDDYFVWAPREKARLLAEQAPDTEIEREAMPRHFEMFWDIFPNKADKDEGLQAWLKLNPGVALREKMMALLRRHVAQHPSSDYIARAVVWIENRLWENERWLSVAGGADK